MSQHRPFPPFPTYSYKYFTWNELSTLKKITTCLKQNIMSFLVEIYAFGAFFNLYISELVFFAIATSVDFQHAKESSCLGNCLILEFWTQFISDRLLYFTEWKVLREVVVKVSVADCLSGRLRLFSLEQFQISRSRLERRIGDPDSFPLGWVTNLDFCSSSN